MCQKTGARVRKIASLFAEIVSNTYTPEDIAHNGNKELEEFKRRNLNYKIRWEKNNPSVCEVCYREKQIHVYQKLAKLIIFLYMTPDLNYAQYK